MEEKIKISLPILVSEIIKKDCIDFKVLKDDRTPNMNSFANMLINNYYEKFCAGESKLHEQLRNALSDLSGRIQENVFEKVLEVMHGKKSEKGKRNDTVIFSFKPTRTSQRAILYIEQFLPIGESISSFYRRMFTSYSEKTKNEREKIIHRENYELLQEAVEKGVNVLVKLKTGIVNPSLSVFSVSPARDELFNYLLAYDGKNNKTIRLATIDTVHLLPEKAVIPEENQDYFKRQIACGAQYPIYPTDNKPIRVKLTKKGKDLFDRIYLYRPVPVSIDGDIYTFECSANQVLYYFERFGENALILSPKKLGIFMRNYYHFAYKLYSNEYR